MPEFTDTFEGDANGTALSNHVGEVGATWVKQDGWTGVATIKNNRLYGGADDYLMMDMKCECGTAIGRVGIPRRDGAGLVGVAFTCPGCDKVRVWQAAATDGRVER